MDAEFWRAGMPSLRTKQRLNQFLCLGVSTLLISTALVGCGSAESEAKNDPAPIVTVPKPKNFDIKVPVEMRDVVVKLYDNFDNTLVLEQQASTTSNLTVTLPSVLNTKRLYRIELSTKPSSLVFDFLSGLYKPLNITQHALIEVDTSNLTQPIFINPSSEAIYQRALIRSGHLPNETVDPTQISELHLSLATQDVNTALLRAFHRNDFPNLNTSNQLNVFTQQDIVSRLALYINTYFSFGYIQQWANVYPTNSYDEFTKNIALDLKDGYLDAKLIRGDNSVLKTLVVTPPDNVDPAKNNLIDIAKNQENTRNLFASSLKQAVLKLANNYQQATVNPDGYRQLEDKLYAGEEPRFNSSQVFRVSGAGDYRRAVGFIDSTETCNGSLFACKQGITGINNLNPNLPSIEYLIGSYKDNTNNCTLNIRANGAVELIKGTQIYRSVLDADSTDNLLQVNKTTREYILNSSSTEPNNVSLEYAFLQVKIKENQVQSASYGLDVRKAPDQLSKTQLECKFI